MPGLSSPTIVDLWDRGESRELFERGLLLLEAIGVDVEAEAGELTLSERDAHLMAARRATLGETLRMYSECPQCGEPIESSIRAAALTRESLPGRSAQPFERAPFRALLRAPSLRDLWAAAAIADPAEARAELVSRCVLEPTRAGAPIALAELPEDVLAAIAADVEEQDPLVDVSVGFACPCCGHAWTRSFDVARFLWTELSVRAKRLMSEVAALARAYGWREPDILAMGAARRRRYLELAAP